MDKDLQNFQGKLLLSGLFRNEENGTPQGIIREIFHHRFPKSYITIFQEGDIVLDPMMGGGTTMIETRILNRRGIGCDINPAAVEISRKNLDFEGSFKYHPVLGLADARDLRELKDETIDLIITHPPYLDIISYSEGQIKEDLSNIEDVDFFLREISKVARENYRVLKKNKYCAILIGDIRKKGHYVPLSYYVMKEYLKAGLY